MVEIQEVYVCNVYKKHNSKEIFKGYYSIGKKIHQDDGKATNEAFALDKESGSITKKIMVILIEDFYLLRKINLNLLTQVM